MKNVRRHPWRARASCLALAVVLWIGPVALAATVEFQDHDVRSVFRIEKSHNRNQVHYGMHLSAACVPLTDAPVYVYWHELERGPNVFLPLLTIEHQAYGIDSQRVTARVVTAGRVSVRLRALPSRELAFESFRDAARSCRGRAVTTIAGRKAVLESVFARIGLLSVESITLHGKTFAGEVVQETLRR